jgi:hypothetical protein
LGHFATALRSAARMDMSWRSIFRMKVIGGTRLLTVLSGDTRAPLLGHLSPYLAPAECCKYPSRLKCFIVARRSIQPYPPDKSSTGRGADFASDSGCWQAPMCSRIGDRPHEPGKSLPSSPTRHIATFAKAVDATPSSDHPELPMPINIPAPGQVEPWCRFTNGGEAAPASKTRANRMLC